MTASITDLGQRSEPTAAPAVVAHYVWSSGIDSPVSRAAFRWRSRSTSWHPLAPDQVPIDPDEYPVVGERITAA
ncbi:MAG: hypothetical protein KJ792_12205, partial [Actinobacteria bacterium]|nr:hypothetical protein [Actinomycetota bacterium]